MRRKEMKKCSKCENIKKKTAFNNKKQSKDGKHGWCRECVKIYYSSEDQITKRRERDYLRKYNITLVDYDYMLEEQGHECAICGTEPFKERFKVDHCHTTGRVRGLLCNHCNLMLGHAQDNKEVLNKAIRYLSSE